MPAPALLAPRLYPFGAIPIPRLTILNASIGQRLPSMIRYSIQAYTQGCDSCGEMDGRLIGIMHTLQ